MAETINMPRLGLTMTEGTITKWLKNVGDKVNKGEFLVEIETDKSVVPYESPVSGIVLKLLAEEMDTIPALEPIAIVGEAGEEPIIEDAVAVSDIVDEEKNDVGSVFGSDKVIDVSDNSSDKVFASPAAKRIAKENGVDITIIPIKKGKERIEKKDVLEYIDTGSIKATPVARKVAEQKNIDLSKIEGSNGQRIYKKDLENISQEDSSASQKNIPLTGMRKVISVRMKESVDTAAHLTTSIDVDMSQILKMKDKMTSLIAEKYDTSLSMNHIIIKCVGHALQKYSRINCKHTDKEIVINEDINIGMAVAVEEGLVVPVINNVNYLSIGEIAKDSHRLVDKARTSGLSPSDMSGGTFTVSNMGMYGISSFTSIINQPESAILSVSSIIKKPVVCNDEIYIKPMMNLTLSYDHRVIDGSMSAIFLKLLKDIIEDPFTLLV